MASGIKIEDEIKEIYNDSMKKGRQLRYLLLGVRDDLKSIGVLKKADRTSTWEDLLVDLKEAESKQECRYVIFDLDFTLANGQEKDKLLFIHWSPDGSKMKQKMIYSSSKEAMKAVLQEGYKPIQANDSGDLNLDEIVTELRNAARN